MSSCYVFCVFCCIINYTLLKIPKDNPILVHMGQFSMLIFMDHSALTQRTAGSESFSWIPRAQGLAVGYHFSLHLSLSGWVFFASFSTCLRQLEEIIDCEYSFWQQVDNTRLCISFSTDAISAATKLSGCLHKIILCLEKMSGVTSRKWWWWEVGKFQRDS